MSYDIKIRTNNHWRDFFYGYELPEKVKANFDYIDEIDTHSFIKYRDHFYDIGEFMRNDGLPDFHPFKAWHGHLSDSYFSGLVIRISDDCEQYQIGSFCS